MMTVEQIVRWLQTVATLMEERKDVLTQLDADIGDGDHGINMDRGFKKVLSQLTSVQDKDIGQIMQETGMTLVSSVGGASGPLYGTFFLRAAAVPSGKRQLTLDELASLLKAGLSGLMDRGRAVRGDKTMVDALAPAVDTLQRAAQENREIKEALAEALLAAEEGMKSTIPMIAKKGRASYLGERSIGHQDPGATSSYLILKALHDSVQ
jgi:dihydroxyacetone kinase-like protein